MSLAEDTTQALTSAVGAVTNLVSSVATAAGSAATALTCPTGATLRARGTGQACATQGAVCFAAPCPDMPFWSCPTGYLLTDNGCVTQQTFTPPADGTPCGPIMGA